MLCSHPTVVTYAHRLSWPAEAPAEQEHALNVSPPTSDLGLTSSHFRPFSDRGCSKYRNSCAMFPPTPDTVPCHDERTRFHLLR